MGEIFVALGSNLANRQENLQLALRKIAEFSTLTRVSRIYESEPYYLLNQARFLNQVAAIVTSISPLDLLEKLKLIEKEMGRQPTTERYGPRPIDLDILYYGHQIIDTPDLTLPHPRISERPFVLVPLAEIAPDFLCVNRGQRIKQMAQPYLSSIDIWPYQEI